MYCRVLCHDNLVFKMHTIPYYPLFKCRLWNVQDIVSYIRFICSLIPHTSCTCIFSGIRTGIIRSKILTAFFPLTKLSCLNVHHWWPLTKIYLKKKCPISSDKLSDWDLHKNSTKNLYIEFFKANLSQKMQPPKSPVLDYTYSIT